jgi:hypothetical protein
MMVWRSELVERGAVIAGVLSFFLRVLARCFHDGVVERARCWGCHISRKKELRMIGLGNEEGVMGGSWWWLGWWNVVYWHFHTTAIGKMNYPLSCDLNVLTSTFTKKKIILFSFPVVACRHSRLGQCKSFCHNNFVFLSLSQSEGLSVIALLNFCLSFPVRIAMPTTISKAVLRNGTENLVECWGWWGATRFVIFALLLFCCALLSNLLLILLIGSLILLHICPCFY